MNSNIETEIISHQRKSQTRTDSSQIKHDLFRFTFDLQVFVCVCVHAHTFICVCGHVHANACGDLEHIRCPEVGVTGGTEHQT